MVRQTIDTREEQADRLEPIIHPLLPNILINYSAKASLLFLYMSPIIWVKLFYRYSINMQHKIGKIYKPFKTSLELRPWEHFFPLGSGLQSFFFLTIQRVLETSVTQIIC